MGAEFGLTWVDEPRGEVVVLRGDPLRLNCSARSTLLDGDEGQDNDNSGERVHITWLKDGRPVEEEALPLVTRDNNISSSSGNNRDTTAATHDVPGTTLHLRRVTRKAEGRYQCIASNSAGSLLSHEILVRTAGRKHFTFHFYFQPHFVSAT